jgi:hypothetical protein
MDTIAVHAIAVHAIAVHAIAICAIGSLDYFGGLWNHNLSDHVCGDCYFVRERSCHRRVEENEKYGFRKRRLKKSKIAQGHDLGWFHAK